MTQAPMSSHSRRTPRPRRPPRPRLFAVLVALAMLPVGADGATPGEQLLSDVGSLDRYPRIDRGWVTWTADASVTESLGTVVVRNPESGALEPIGMGFKPDITVAPLWAAPSGEPVSDLGLTGTIHDVRVAFLRVEPGGTFAVMSAVRRSSGTWTTTVLASSLDWADEVRVEGDHTAWSGAPSGGPIRIWVHDGVTARAISESAPSFRPELARDTSGTLHLVWDSSLGSPGSVRYEVFTSRLQGGQWTTPRDLSLSPLSMDLNATLAPDPDGGMWFTWSTDRGNTMPPGRRRRMQVIKIKGGTMMLPAAYPTPADPADLGLVDLGLSRGAFDPELVVDPHGRPWLFVHELMLGSRMPFDKQHHVARYEDSGWVVLPDVSSGPQTEGHLAVEVGKTWVSAVYSTDVAGETDIARADLAIGSAGAAPVMHTAQPLAQPPVTVPVPQLAEVPPLDIDGQLYQLHYADLHSHTGLSPDAMGELDGAVVWARDRVGLDVLASTEHDHRGQSPYTDYEYAQTSSLLAHFDDDQFITFPGFEWTNDAFTCGPMGSQKIIGHRAVFGSSKLYRYTTPPYDDLGSFYMALLAEDALGVPHHLPWFGGTTFQDDCFDATVQPVSEIASVHGVFELALANKLAPQPLGDGKRFGITAAGDGHTARPGVAGLAGLWVDPALPRHAATKEALRSRRCFGLRFDGFGVDVRINGAPMGQAVSWSPGEPLLLDYQLLGFATPSTDPETLHVQLVDMALPDHLEEPMPFSALHVLPPGVTPVVGGKGIPLPPPTGPAIYVLRVTSGQGVEPDDTLAWSSPIWVDPQP